MKSAGREGPELRESAILLTVFTRTRSTPEGTSWSWTMFWESSSGTSSLRGYMLVRMTLSGFVFSSCKERGMATLQLRFIQTHSCWYSVTIITIWHWQNTSWTHTYSNTEHQYLHCSTGVDLKLCSLQYLYFHQKSLVVFPKTNSYN